MKHRWKSRAAVVLLALAIIAVFAGCSKKEEAPKIDPAAINTDGGPKPQAMQLAPAPGQKAPAAGGSTGSLNPVTPN